MVIRSGSVVTILLLLLLTGCVATEPAPTPPQPGQPTTPADDPPSASPSPNTSAAQWTHSPAAQAELDRIRQLCTPGDGKKITELDDPQIPGVNYQGVHQPGVEVPDVNLPDTRGEAGCIVEYAAPAACLGAVEISAAVMPGLRIPGYRVTLPDGTVAAEGADITRDEVVTPGRKVAQQCQPKTTGRITPAVIRAATIRAATILPADLRAAGLIPPVCNAGDCTEAVVIQALTVQAATLPAATVQAKVLEAKVSSTTTSYDGDEEKAYQASADVFFDYDTFNLKPAAKKILDGIIADIAKVSPKGAVRVEGHTDSDGSNAHNQTLSERRAKAVADYLTSRGIEAARITSRGYGETVPAAPNTSEANMAKNRRVIIAVSKD